VVQFSQKQAGEIWITAAQSFFAVALLASVEISTREAVALLGSFALLFLPLSQDFEERMLFTGVYLVLGIALLVRRRSDIPTVVDRVRHYGSRYSTEPPSSVTSAKQ
jgi:cation:H+ antiporter